LLGAEKPVAKIVEVREPPEPPPATGPIPPPVIDPIPPSTDAKEL
jgi:hypothetical protein